MITVLDLRQHILTAADELDLPLTLRQVDRLATRVAARAAGSTAPEVRLTNRMFEVLIGLASGEESEGTARRLGLTAHTVKTHKRLLYTALGAANGAQAVAVAMGLGLLRTAQKEAAGRSEVGA